MNTTVAEDKVLARLAAGPLGLGDLGSALELNAAANLTRKGLACWVDGRYSLAAQAVAADSKPCDKCGIAVAMHGGWSGVACFDCRKVYVRCENCGGDRGARRSLKSHRGLYHPAVR